LTQKSETLTKVVGQISSLTFATATDDDIFSGMKPLTKSSDVKASVET
jgi:hypothetical protein